MGEHVTFDGVDYTVIGTSYDYTFFDWKLTGLTLPPTFANIGPAVFAMNNFTTVELPADLVSIGDNAFSSVPLTSLVLPDKLATIGERAFNLNQFTTVTIPASVTSIGNQAFADTPLTDVYFAGAAPTTFTPIGLLYPSDGSLGAAGSGPTVHYLLKYDASHVDGGFTPGTWQGYTSVAMATVTFDSGGGTAVSPAVVDLGSTVTEPAAPTRAGYTFGGWYTDGSDTTKYDFTTSLADDLTLHAKWIDNSVVVPPSIASVTLDSSKRVVATAAAGSTGGAVLIEYSIQKNKQQATGWAAYTGPLQVDAKSTVSFRAIDAAGNTSAIVSVNRKDLH